MAIKIEDIRECFDDREESRKLAFHPVSADEAYERLRIVRNTYNEFGDAINKHVRTIPTISRRKYEIVFEALDELIKEECYNVENGD